MPPLPSISPCHARLSIINSRTEGTALAERNQVHHLQYWARGSERSARLPKRSNTEICSAAHDPAQMGRSAPRSASRWSGDGGPHRLHQRGGGLSRGLGTSTNRAPFNILTALCYLGDRDDAGSIHDHPSTHEENE